MLLLLSCSKIGTKVRRGKGGENVTSIFETAHPVQLVCVCVEGGSLKCVLCSPVAAAAATDIHTTTATATTKERKKEKERHFDTHTNIANKQHPPPPSSPSPSTVLIRIPCARDCYG